MLLEWASSGEVVPHAGPRMGETSHPVSVVASRNKNLVLDRTRPAAALSCSGTDTRFMVFSPESSERARPIGALIERYRPVHQSQEVRSSLLPSHAVSDILIRSQTSQAVSGSLRQSPAVSSSQSLRQETSSLAAARLLTECCVATLI